MTPAVTFAHLLTLMFFSFHHRQENELYLVRRLSSQRGSPHYWLNRDALRLLSPDCDTAFIAPHRKLWHVSEFKQVDELPDDDDADADHA